MSSHGYILQPELPSALWRVPTGQSLVASASDYYLADAPSVDSPPPWFHYPGTSASVFGAAERPGVLEEGPQGSQSVCERWSVLSQAGNLRLNPAVLKAWSLTWSLVLHRPPARLCLRLFSPAWQARAKCPAMDVAAGWVGQIACPILGVPCNHWLPEG